MAEYAPQVRVRAARQLLYVSSDTTIYPRVVNNEQIEFTTFILDDDLHHCVIQDTYLDSKLIVSYPHGCIVIELPTPELLDF